MGSNSPLENVDPLLDSSPLPPTHYSGILATCPRQHFSKEPACTHTLVNSNRRLFIGFSDSQSRDLRTIISRSDPYTEQKDLVKGKFQCDRKLKTSKFLKADNTLINIQHFPPSVCRSLWGNIFFAEYMNSNSMGDFKLFS